MIQVFTEDRRLLASHVREAKSLLSRMKGLLGQRGLSEEEGLWLEPCNSIHTFFMSFPIDAIFLSNEKAILKIYPNMGPFRMTRIVRGARSVLELPAGRTSQLGLGTGDRLNTETVS